MNKTLAFAVPLILISALACTRSETASTGNSTGAPAGGSGRPLTIKGSDTMVILGQRLAEEYMKVNSGRSVQVNGGGSGTGIAALINGTVDLAQSSRPMKGDEKASAEKTRGSQIVETPVALDSLAVFVHESNPIRELTMQQVSDIYTGKLRNWKEVGGGDAPIITYGRENSSGTYDYFREHVLNKTDFSPTVQTLQGTAAVVNSVSRDKNSIGYGGIAYDKGARALAIKKDAQSPGIAPTEATVADNSYPIARNLYFYSFANAPERVTHFIQWSLTAEAQALVKNVGYFPLNNQPAAATATDATATAGSTATTATR